MPARDDVLPPFLRTFDERLFCEDVTTQLAKRGRGAQLQCAVETGVSRRTLQYMAKFSCVARINIILSLAAYLGLDLRAYTRSRPARSAVIRPLGGGVGEFKRAVDQTVDWALVAACAALTCRGDSRALAADLGCGKATADAILSGGGCFPGTFRRLCLHLRLEPDQLAAGWQTEPRWAGFGSAPRNLARAA